MISFEDAGFCSGVVTFKGVKFSGAQVDFRDVGGWSCPPEFPRHETPQGRRSGDSLICRVVGESSEWVWSEESGAIEISLSPGRLMGAYNAGIADDAWGDLPMPMLSNPRVRFWFTERGWRAYGLRVAAEARASGRAFRVMRRKNPPKSTVVYRDDWQIALLPDRD